MIFTDCVFAYQCVCKKEINNDMFLMPLKWKQCTVAGIYSMYCLFCPEDKHLQYMYTLLLIKSNMYTQNYLATAVCQKHSDERYSSKTNMCIHRAFRITIAAAVRLWSRLLLKERFLKCGVCTQLGDYTNTCTQVTQAHGNNITFHITNTGLISILHSNIKWYSGILCAHMQWTI